MSFKLEVVITIASILYWFAVSFFALVLAFIYGLIWSALFFGLLYLPYYRLLRWLLQE